MTLNRALSIACRHSDYVADWVARHPTLLDESCLMSLDRSRLDIDGRLLLSIEDETDFRQALRRLRHRQLIRIAVRDLAGLAGLEETLTDTSDVADALIRTAYGWSYERLRALWGTPIGRQSGQPQQMIVLTMGKLGGRELNFSSDVDLIFAYAENGETQGGPRQIDNGEFFIKLGRMMNAALTTVTDWGFVYRVDMRLRPFGTAGQLAQSFDALENYYQTHGRPWERHALVKARAITGTDGDIGRLHDILMPFVYRGYVDFSMLDSLRDLKRMISQDLARKGHPQDLKLGVGGIRDIEFIVQSFQLIHGGRDITLRGQSLLPTLDLLGRRHYLDQTVTDQLRSAYALLRRVENHLQMANDHQTHGLPNQPDRLDLLAQGVGFADRIPFLEHLTAQRALVADHFDAVFQTEVPAVATAWDQMWRDPMTAPPPACADADVWRDQLAAFQRSAHFLGQTAEDRQRLDGIIPALLADIPDGQTLKRVLQVLDSILRRSVYLLLLKSSSQARQSLITLCAASPWLTDTLAATPALLDQMLDPDQLFTLSNRAQLEAEMHLQLGAAPDEEQLMTVLRHTKNAAVFKVAACDLINGLPLMKVSDHLTWTAEAVVQVALDHLWRMALIRHGRPGGWTDDRPPFLVIGFGKLGGLEMGYGSDLDMVFLCHDDLPATEMSEGPHALEGAIYVTRLGQKVIRALSTTLVSGVAYQVDSRLRPHGASGNLINSLEGFFTYERRQAWVWEHQALIRTRAIAGHPQMMARFETLRRDFLCQPRDPERLRQEVLSMRQKMRTHLDASTPDRFDLKQGEGGIIDLEFLVQFLILRHAQTHPALAQFSDNIRQMAALAQAGIISQNQQDDLTQAYLGLRGLAHRAALAKTDAMTPWAATAPWRQSITRLWTEHLL